MHYKIVCKTFQSKQKDSIFSDQTREEQGSCSISFKEKYQRRRIKQVKITLAKRVSHNQLCFNLMTEDHGARQQENENSIYDHLALFCKKLRQFTLQKKCRRVKKKNKTKQNKKRHFDSCFKFQPIRKVWHNRRKRNDAS